MNTSESHQNSAPWVSVFDLDGTLTKHDTFQYFLVWYVAQHPSAWAQGLPLVGHFSRFFAGRCDNTWLKSEVLKTLSRSSRRATLEAAGRRFAQVVLTRLLRPGARSLLDSARKAGDRLVLATSSPSLYVEPLAERLGFDGVLSTELAWREDGTIAGLLNGENCRSEIKARRVQDWIDREVGPARVRVYTDHHSDLPLLLLGEQRFMVGPTRLLLAAADENRLVEHEFKSAR
jgi:phosphatidylglycerophosphatase C